MREVLHETDHDLGELQFAWSVYGSSVTNLAIVFKVV